MLLADPDHPRWGDDGLGYQALGGLPAQVTSTDDLTAPLLADPSVLPDEVLDWPSEHLLYCGGPPYGPGWEAGG